MKTKYYIHALLMLLPVITQAQTMQWIPTPAQSSFGKCSDQSTKSGMTQCYVLEYTPAVSGVLTSYTTGFLVSCTSLGSAITKNQSCSMTANSRVVNGCESFGKVLLNSSGNSGTITNNQIVAGIPVILHQVCLTIPSGETVTIEEDPVTDLTTSVDLGNNMFTTEFPGFEIATFKKPRYDDATHSAFLDFQGRSAGNLVSQLDWSTKYQGEGLTYVIQRSFDGETFDPIGTMEGQKDGQSIGSYQFFDKGAQYGTNFYRLLQLDANGKESYSPVREILFEEYPFAVVASPNPAKEKLYVSIQEAKEPGIIKLIDVSGNERLVSDFELRESNLILEIGQFEPGVYNLQVTSGKDVFVEKIVVIR
jgi:hypothetical protein